jgi:putative DNA primase/helicase
MARAEELVIGRWADVLAATGIPESALSGRNTPCPLCGGKDRFRWNRGKELWVCTHCTEGKYAGGFRLLMDYARLPFWEAADHVRALLGTGPANSAASIAPRTRVVAHKEMTEEERGKRLARIRTFVDQAKPVKAGDPVDRYLRQRVRGAEPEMLEDILHHPHLPYWQAKDGGGYELLGTYPAMLAIARNAKGEVVQLHKTYLTSGGEKAPVPCPKKTDLGVGETAFAIRIFQITGEQTVMGIAEGIETALAASQRHHIPVWPTLNGASMARFEIPAELRERIHLVRIFQDNDPWAFRMVKGVQRRYRPGQEYAQQASAKLKSQGVRTLIVTPARTGQDMADLHQQVTA